MEKPRRKDKVKRTAKRNAISGRRRHPAASVFPDRGADDPNTKHPLRHRRADGRREDCEEVAVLVVSVRCAPEDAVTASRTVNGMDKIGQ